MHPYNTVDGFTLNMLSITLAVLYGMAAVIRARAIRIGVFAKWYWVTVGCCIFSSLSFVWLLFRGDSDTRLTLARVVQLVAVSSIYIWSPYTTIRDRKEEIDRSRTVEQRNNVKSV